MLREVLVAVRKRCLYQHTLQLIEYCLVFLRVSFMEEFSQTMLGLTRGPSSNSSTIEMRKAEATGRSGLY